MEHCEQRSTNSDIPENEQNIKLTILILHILDFENREHTKCQFTWFISYQDTGTERGGSMVTHETCIWEAPGSNPSVEKPD